VSWLNLSTLDLRAFLGKFQLIGTPSKFEKIDPDERLFGPDSYRDRALLFGFFGF